jgi:hypothetical protein
MIHRLSVELEGKAKIEAAAQAAIGGANSELWSSYIDTFKQTKAMEQASECSGLKLSILFLARLFPHAVFEPYKTDTSKPVTHLIDKKKEWVLDLKTFYVYHLPTQKYYCCTTEPSSKKHVMVMYDDQLQELNYDHVLPLPGSSEEDAHHQQQGKSIEALVKPIKRGIADDAEEAAKRDAENFLSSLPLMHAKSPSNHADQAPGDAPSSSSSLTLPVGSPSSSPIRFQFKNVQASPCSSSNEASSSNDDMLHLLSTPMAPPAEITTTTTKQHQISVPGPVTVSLPIARQQQHTAAASSPLIICQVCMRKFGSAEQLDKHEKFSELHQKNLKLRKETTS